LYAIATSLGAEQQLAWIDAAAPTETNNGGITNLLRELVRN
jgi:hypothetical protein